MAKSDNLKRDFLIERSERFIYQLFQSIDHYAFHEERKLKFEKHVVINSALIKIFAHRLTYENFGMVKTIIVQVAEEIATAEIRDELKLLESDNNEYLNRSDSDASKLMKILLFLLHKEVEKCLKEKEKREREAHRRETIGKWSKIIQVAEKIAAAEKGGNADASEIDVSKLIKIILFLLRDEINRYSREKEKREKEKAGMSADRLENQESKPPSTNAREVNTEPERTIIPETPPLADNDLNSLVASMGDRELNEVIDKGMDGLAYPYMFPKITEEMNEGSDNLTANVREELLTERIHSEISSNKVANEAKSKKNVSSANPETDDLAARIGEEELDELIFWGIIPKDIRKEEKEEEEKEKWMGWVD